MFVAASHFWTKELSLQVTHNTKHTAVCQCKLVLCWQMLPKNVSVKNLNIQKIPNMSHLEWIICQWWDDAPLKTYLWFFFLFQDLNVSFSASVFFFGEHWRTQEVGRGGDRPPQVLRWLVKAHWRALSRMVKKRESALLDAVYMVNTWPNALQGVLSHNKLWWCAHWNQNIQEWVLMGAPLVAEMWCHALYGTLVMGKGDVMKCPGAPMVRKSTPQCPFWHRREEESHGPCVAQ